MVIEYQIKRFGLVKLYFYNLRHSQRTRFIIFGVAILVVAYTLFLRYRTQGHLVVYDFIVAFMMALGFIVAVPALSFITAKTQKRILSIGPEGIETKIGSKEGRIPWKAVDSIAVTQEHILITGKNANAFTIPPSAFASPEQRQNFIDLATQLHANVTR